MSAGEYLPRKQSDVLGFAQNMVSKIGADPVPWGIDAASFNDLSAQTSTLGQALALLNDPMTRSEGNVENKNRAGGRDYEHPQHRAVFDRQRDGHGCDVDRDRGQPTEQDADAGSAAIADPAA